MKVAEAIKQAGEDPDVLRARPKPVVEWSNETIEETTDVVVIGTGGAGLSAAASVLEQGKDVIMLENSQQSAVTRFVQADKSMRQSQNGKINSRHYTVNKKH